MVRRSFLEMTGLTSLALSVEGKEQSNAKPLVIAPESATVYDSGHGQTSIMVAGKQTGGRWWLGHLKSDPGRKTSLHVHFSAAEQVYVLEGKLSLWVDGRWQELTAGGVAEIPAGIQHALGNRTKDAVRFLMAGEPAGFELFFADLEVAAKRHAYGSPEFLAELAEIYEKYDSKLVGPPPEG